MPQTGRALFGSTTPETQARLPPACHDSRSFACRANALRASRSIQGLRAPSDFHETSSSALLHLLIPSPPDRRVSSQCARLCYARLSPEEARKTRSDLVQVMVRRVGRAYMLAPTAPPSHSTRCATRALLKQGAGPEGNASIPNHRSVKAWRSTRCNCTKMTDPVTAAQLTTGTAKAPVCAKAGFRPGNGAPGGDQRSGAVGAGQRSSSSRCQK